MSKKSSISIYVTVVLALALNLAFTSPSFAQELQPLTQAKIATGSANIAKVTLVGQTREYRHFVLGRDHEAKGFVADMADGRRVAFALPDGLVFEDRIPRLADMNGDGADEIILVMSSVTQGASLAIFEIIENGARKLAQTPHIGLANRWLNPAGIADFDGDGNLDIALVQMPHLVKRLEVWSLKRGELLRTFSEDNVSNHRGGSQYQGLSAQVDMNQDGILDLIIPDGSRRTLRVLSFVSNSVTELGSINLPAPTNGDFVLQTEGGQKTLNVPLETGETVQIQL